MRPKALLIAVVGFLIAGSLAWSGSAVASGSGGDEYWFTDAQVVSSSGRIEAEAVAVSDDDTVFVTGFFSGTVSFPTGRAAPDDSITITSPGFSMYVASISPDDTYFSWVVPVSAPGESVVGMGMSVTSDGTPLVTGYFSGYSGGAATFPTGPTSSISLTATGTDGFVAALNRDDSYFAWAVAAGGSTTLDYVDPQAIAVTADDTPIITGYFYGTVSFPTGRAAPDDSITLVGSTSKSDVFVAALNRDDSTFVWAVKAGGTGNDSGQSLAFTSDDTAIITGYFEGTATFPTGPGTSISLTSTGGLDLFVAGMSADDSYFSWAVNAGGTGRDFGNGVAVTSDDTAIITGYFEGTASFPTGSGTPITLTSTAGSRDIFVAGMSADDSYFSWAVKAGGSGNDEGYGVAVTSDDTAIITGQFDVSARFPTGRPAPDDSITLTTAADDGLFVAGMSLVDSVFSWASGATGTADSYGRGVGATSTGSAVAVGYASPGALEFPTGPSSSLSFTATGTESLVTAWLGPFAAPPAPSAPTITGLSPATGSIAGGTSVTITGTDLTGATSVTFGGAAATITSNTATQVVVTTPAGAAGAVDVAVTTAGGTATSVGAFTYVADPGPDPTPPVTLPPSAPLGVSGVGGDSSAVISWTTPLSPGSFPISTYEAVVSPGGQSCLVSAPSTSCTITGLSNGTDYLARVRALNGAGWGTYSAFSPAFTPQATTPSIVISGTRGEVRSRPGVVVTGTATGVSEGAILRPWMRFPGQARYAEGTARIGVNDDGEFTWQRRTGKKIYVVITTDSGDVRSNRVIIPARR